MGRYRNIIVYKDYFENFLNTQPPKVQRKILQILRVIEEVEVIPSNHIRHLEGTEGLYEIRVIFGGKLFRVFCFFDSGKMVILLSGFQKKSTKTPAEMIRKNTRLMREYFKEKNNKEL